ncbi:dihydrofolate reductase family protein [Agromyces intestinalis]|uniref:Dihydrofolate reductase family protein n=1 Tax=Agromyces intestinalis TaxID=2592652 RepID=A0A5C1YE40_9MICO|nr:dihydrofolate reductase family protein [Agromyces intestinalis]QEO14366.1 dihydrofolate reductase family protein [Agromyces intestinalis]
MGRLIVSTTVSLDGYVNDAGGSLDWAAPDEQMHAFINARLSGIGTFLFGRRLYETMRVWDEVDVSDSPAMAEFAELWAAADKIVYSSSLDSVDTARTTLERTFDADAVRAFVEASDRDVEVGGPTLAATAFGAGIVDELSVYVAPVVLGGGTRLLPDGVRFDLELVDEHRFADGTVYLSYRVR